MAKYNKDREGARKYAQEVGRRIKARLEYFDMTQLELSKRSGVDHSEISKYIRGKTMPLAMSAVKIAHALNMNVSDLIDVEVN